MANNFKTWIDAPTTNQNVQSLAVFEADGQRVDGFKAGDPASAIRINSALRQANVVVAALMQMCDEVKALPTTLSLLSTVTQVKTSIKSAIDQLDATVLTSAKSYTDTAANTTNTALTSLQSKVTTNTTNITSHETRLDEHDDEIAALSGGSSTLGTRVTTLENEMDTAQTDITNLKTVYSTNIATNSWIAQGEQFYFSIFATIHKRGTKPRVFCYYNENEMFTETKVSATGDVTVYSNARLALNVSIY